MQQPGEQVIQKTVSVPAGADAVLAALTGIAVATKKALADGFQPGQDLPAIVAEAWKDLPPAIAGFGEIGSDVKDLPGMVACIGIHAADLVQQLTQPSA